MQVRTKTTKSASVVEVGGEVIMTTSPDLRKALSEAARQKPERLLVKLTDVTYMDSSGIATLVECLHRTRSYGGRLYLVGMRDEILGILKLVRLDEVFRIVRSEEDAFQDEGPTQVEVK